MQIARAEDYIRLEHLVDGEGLDLEEQLEEIKKGQRPVGAGQPKLRVCHLYGPSSFDPKHVSIMAESTAAAVSYGLFVAGSKVWGDSPWQQKASHFTRFHR